MPRRLTYVIGATIDGFIAGPNGEVDFFPVTSDVVDFLGAELPETLPTHVRASLGLDTPNERFDTIVQGRATYAMAANVGITSPYAHLRQYVVSRSLSGSPDAAVTVIPDDPVAAVRELKRQDGLGIYLAGGGNLAGQLLDEIDELVVKRYPTLAGAGIPMFATGLRPQPFALTGTLTLAGGTIVEHYTRG